MLRKFLVAFALVLAPPALAGQRAADTPVEIVKGPYVVADVATGRIIDQNDALRPWYPASTTKMMTAYVTFRAIRAGELSLDSLVTYGADAATQPPSKMGFAPGTVLTLDNALKMMLVKSANDIAVAVADRVGGSVDGFAARMNAEAARLGMTRSHFVNPNGLPDERHVSSARDMALLASALLRDFPEYRGFFNIHAIQIGKRVLKNYNRLLERYPGAEGMKTGFICASGYNLVASARRGGRELVAVVFGEYRAKGRNEHAAQLLDEGFQSPDPDPAGPPAVTLATTTSGAGFDAAPDMRPSVCGRDRKKVLAAMSEEDDGDDDAPHLGDPAYLGPPVQVSVVASAPQTVADSRDYARIPRPRPHRPGDPVEAGMAAFAPVEPAGITSIEQAIDAAAGAALPLKSVAPN